MRDGRDNGRARASISGFGFEGDLEGVPRKKDGKREASSARQRQKIPPDQPFLTGEWKRCVFRGFRSTLLHRVRAWA